MAEQRVTDDVLEHWASEAKKESPGKLGSINLPAVVEMLIAEVRASRAREAELLAERDDWAAMGRIEVMGRLGQLGLERDALQQRINNLLAATYASDDGTEYTHDHRREDGQPECPACWVHDIRTALTGALPI